jgi:hypothetical protein
VNEVDGVFYQDERRLSRHIAENDTWETIEGYRLVLVAKNDTTPSNELREALAAYAHEAWSGWMRWMFEHGGQVTSHVHGQSYWVMLPEKYERWQRQMSTPYADLPENEKASDRAEADKMLAIIYGNTPLATPAGAEESEVMG